MFINEFSRLSNRLTAAMATVPNSTENKSKLQRTSCEFLAWLYAHRDSRILQAKQLESADTSMYIMGVMVESNLVEGRQDIPSSGAAGLKYGQSVTDACISWEMTIPVLDRLREGVQARRKLVIRRAKGLDENDGVKINGQNGHA
jgi:hypothetical protein